MDPDAAQERRRLVARARRVTRAKGWPWQRTGAVSYALDEHGRVTRYLATESGPVPLTPGEEPEEAPAPAT